MSLSERINDTNAAPWVIEEIKKLEAERDALAARVTALEAENAAMDQERSRARLEAAKLAAHVERMETMRQQDPAIFLARLKAQWQAEVLETLLYIGGTSNWSARQIEYHLNHLRRQAEEDA